MASAIEEQLLKIRREAEEREAKRKAEEEERLRKEQPAAKKITGAVDIEERRVSDLAGQLAGLSKVREFIINFNFQELSITEVLEVVIAGAVANRVSDIHFEPESAKTRIRFRIDGLLSDIADNFPETAYRELVSRIKILSRLKLDVIKRPQDGRFSVKLGGREVEVRVSVVPSEFGETVVMRILDPAVARIPLQDLGLRPDDLEIVLKEIQRPHGMILNTGPTGSGKTTTLYSFLRKRHSPEVKIITIEDPIEYHLDGVEQTQIDPESGYTFANGLAAVMRQDPDIILVGEIRDKDTASAAIQAALTGHLVFSTIHANQAVAAISRLVDLGVKEESIGPAVNLIMAQRLVRKLCPKCRVPEVIDYDLELKIKKFLDNLSVRVHRSEYQNPTIYKAGNGCADCDNNGYKGRIGLFELFTIGTEKSPAITIRQDGVLKVLKGITDFTEVERIAGSLEW